MSVEDTSFGSLTRLVKPEQLRCEASKLSLRVHSAVANPERRELCRSSSAVIKTITSESSITEV